MYGSTTWSKMARSSRFLSTGIALVCTFTILSFWHVLPRDRIFPFRIDTNSQNQNPAIGFKPDATRLKDARNSTLGVRFMFRTYRPDT